MHTNIHHEWPDLRAGREDSEDHGIFTADVECCVDHSGQDVCDLADCEPLFFLAHPLLDFARKHIDHFLQLGMMVEVMTFPSR